MRKRVSNLMEDPHRLSLQKSTKEHKVEDKSWSMKRKLGENKDSFRYWRNGNASKIKFNAFCDEHDIENETVEIEEADASTKIAPNRELLQV